MMSNETLDNWSLSSELVEQLSSNIPKGNWELHGASNGYFNLSNLGPIYQYPYTTLVLAMGNFQIIQKLKQVSPGSCSENQRKKRKKHPALNAFGERISFGKLLLDRKKAQPHIPVLR